MRTDTVTIGGKEYSIRGLSVSQALETDLERYEASEAKDRKALTAIRLKRVAMSLQRGNAYLPDLKSPVDERGEHKGQIGAASMTIEAITAWLDSDVFSDMLEFYTAEKKVMALADPLKAAPKDQGAGDGPGESPAPE